MSVSIDGKTTQQRDNVDWVAYDDIKRMDALMKECGIMLMGRATYESFGDELPNEHALMVVMTTDQSLLDKTQKNVLFTNDSPKNVLQIIEQKGYSNVVLAGGNVLNASFLRENLVDELRLIIQPIVIGTGKPLFESSKEVKSFELVDVQNLNGGVLEVRYRKI